MTAQVFDGASGQSQSAPLQHPGYVWYGQFSPDSKKLVTSCGAWWGNNSVWSRLLSSKLMPFTPLWMAKTDADRRALNQARVWEVSTGRLLFALGHVRPVTHAEFSADGRCIVTASDDGIAQVWDAEKGQTVAAPLRHAQAVCHATFSPYNRLVLTASKDRTARVWEVTSGRPITEPLRHNGAVLCATFSRDGQRLVTASDDGTTRVWNAVTGQPITPSMRHVGPVPYAIFSPNGQLVASVSTDRTARVWDAATGEPVTPALRHEGSVVHLAFSPDGQRLATASDDGNARIWELGPGAFASRDLGQLAQLLSASRIDSTGTGLEPVDRTTLSNTWHTLQSKYGAMFSSLKEAGTEEHILRARRQSPSDSGNR